jgi:integrase
MPSIHKVTIPGGLVRWRVRYRLPGESKLRSKTFPTRREAGGFSAELRSMQARGAFVDPNAGKIKFGPYAVEVLAARPDEASTRARDQSILRTHVLPEFGGRAMGSITHSEVQRWVTKLGTRRSPATTREAYRILHLVIKTAVRDRIIGHDPCLDVKVPKRMRRTVASGGFPMLSAEDFALVLREVPDRHRLAAALAFGAGLRWGETAALTVRDFTGLTGGPMTVTVKRTLQEVGGAFSIKQRPKSEAGARQVPLPEWVATIVRRHVATYGQRLDDNLIVNEVGGFVSRGYARLYILRPALVRAGLMGHVIRVAGPDDATPTWNATWTDRAGTTHAETFTTEASAVRAVARRHHPAPSSWHGLRHAYVSALVTAGLDPVHVAMAAGHSDPAFTLRTYAHPATDASARIRAAQSHVEVD